MRMPDFITLVWITIAMVSARSFAMAVNRLIDMEIDRRNPRTAERALPKGLLSVSSVIFFSFISLTVFLLAVYNLSPICRYLWPIVVIPFIVYPYTKRFTWLSHFVLGLCLGLAPVGAWIAVTDTISPEPFLIGAAVLLWVAGFDIFYAIQDIAFDRQQKLHSIPASFGVRTSLFLTKILHFISIAFLSWVGIRLNLGIFYFIGVCITAILLTYENSIIKPNDLSKLNMVFFTMNGVVSILMFCFVAMEVIFRRTGNV
jgi:4-hydroxybenzoate polyprenyltransferase